MTLFFFSFYLIARFLAIDDVVLPVFNFAHFSQIEILSFCRKVTNLNPFKMREKAFAQLFSGCIGRNFGRSIFGAGPAGLLNRPVGTHPFLSGAAKCALALEPFIRQNPRESF